MKSKILLWSIFLTLLLTVLQILGLSRSSFMGVQDTSAFANEVLKYYPFVALNELLKIIFIIFIPSLLLCSAVYLSKKSITKFVLIAIYSLSYICLFLGSVFQYPALYQEFFNPQFNQLIFKYSQNIQPNYLFITSVVIILSSLILLNRKLRYLLSIIFICISFFSFPFPFAKPAKRPLVLVIGIDSFRYDYLRPDIVPNISELKNDPATVSFHDHIIGIPRTFPSWMEILQGKYSAQTGIRHMFPNLKNQRMYSKGLVSTLASLGFRTSVHSDFAGDIFPRFNAGFEEIDTPNFTLQALTRMTIAQSFPLFLPIITRSWVREFFPDLLENPSFSDPKSLIAKSLKPLIQSSDPRLLTLFFSSAHFPYAAPWPWYSKYANSNYSGPYFFKKDPDLSQSTPVSEEDIHQIRSLYAGSLSAIDAALGNLFHFLKSHDLWTDTMIVITADHGEDLFEFERIQGHGEHLQGENVLKVPLLIKIPGQAVFSKNIDFTTRMIDLAPTIAGLLHTQLETAQGADLSPWIRTKLPRPSLTAYSETEIWFSRTGHAFFQKERIDYPNIASLLSLDIGGTGAIALNPTYENILITAKHRSLTQGRFKLIYTPTSEGVFFKLYDRIDDPQNLTDISSKNMDVFNSMKRLMFEQISQLETRSKLIENYVVPL